MNDLLVLLPGIMGSELKKDGRKVWGFSASVLGSTLLTRGAQLSRELLLSADDPASDDLGDGIVADAVLPDLNLIPGFWKVDGYGKIARQLQERFVLEEGKNFFHFPYDWRRDNRVAARKLARASKGWLESWRAQNPTAKLILVAHSMGGLVARYFLEVLEGWRDTRALVTFGTPYRGSLNAVGALANGVRGALGLIELSAMTRSLTSVYQLLPTYECYDDGGGGALQRVGQVTGIPNIDPARASAALDFHNEIRAAVDAHMGDVAYVRDRYSIHPIVGIGQRTKQSARLTHSGAELLETIRDQSPMGDGTVPRMSATPVEYSSARREIYARTCHASLQNSEVALTQLGGIVSGLTLDLGEFLGADPAPPVEPNALALEVEELLLAAVPLVVRVLPEEPLRTAPTGAVYGADDSKLRDLVFTKDGSGYRSQSGPLPAGIYRLSVSAPGCDTVGDSFAVAATA